MNSEVSIYLAYRDLPEATLDFLGKANGFELLPHPDLLAKEDWMLGAGEEKHPELHVTRLTWPATEGRRGGKTYKMHCVVYTDHELERGMGMQICLQGYDFASRAGLLT